MRLKPLLLTLAAFAMLSGSAVAATEVRMAGDARVYGVFFANRNFTGWNETGTQTEDRLSIWQRFRLRADFVANENLKFRFGMRVGDEAWGAGTLTAANPQAAIEPYLAYLQFKWPGSDIEITAGYQPVSAPHSEAFYDSIVLAADDGDQSSAALFVKVPFGENVALEAAFARLLAANRTYQEDTTQVGDNFDIYRLALPVTVEGFEVTPWAMAGVYGQASDPDGLFNAGLRSAGSYLDPTGYKRNQNSMWWTGLAANITALDPVKFYLDAIYGDAGAEDRSRNRRRGYFFDAAVTYAGLDWAVPGLYGWIGSGEDASLANGSERLPVITPKWGPATNFLFDNDQEFANNSIGVDPTGTYGLAAALKEVSFIEALKSRLSVAMIAGRNSPAGLRKAVLATDGPGNYATMGRTLAEGEWVLGVSFDHAYAITEELSLNLQTGFATPQGLKTSIWGHRMTNAATEAWMASLGLLYTF
jgi:hypothetical protein